MLYASRKTEKPASEPPEVPRTGLFGTKMVDSSCSTQWQLSGDILQRDDEKFRGVRPVLGHSVATLVFVEVDGSFFTKELANHSAAMDDQESTTNAPNMLKTALYIIPEARGAKRCGAFVCMAC